MKGREFQPKNLLALEGGAVGAAIAGFLIIILVFGTLPPYLLEKSVALYLSAMLFLRVSSLRQNWDYDIAFLFSERLSVVIKTALANIRQALS